MKMYYAYVLKSATQEYFYKGHCHDIEKRLLQHNSGMTESIRPYIPFKLVYLEQFELERKPFYERNTLSLPQE